MATATAIPNLAARRASLAIIAILILAIVAALGWRIFWKIRRPGDYELTEVMPPAAAAYQIAQAISGGGAAPNPNVQQFQAGDFNFIAIRNNNNWTLRLNFAKSDLLPPDQAAALLARFRLTGDAGFAKSLNVSDDQIKQLKEIPAGTGLVVTDPNRARIHAAWDKYIAKPNPQAQQELIKAAQEVGDASLQPTRTALSDRAQKVQAILTPQQIAPFK